MSPGASKVTSVEPFETISKVVVPPSLIITFAPPASIIRSPGASKVTSVAPFETMSNVVVPPSLIVTFAPSPSRIISLGPSSVIFPEDVPTVTAASPVEILSAAILALVYVFN